MTILRYIHILVFSNISLLSVGQCSFQYISNDTLFQDYIEFISPIKNVNEIITIGSRINRGIINDSIFNAPVFQIFDDCGNILHTTIYKYIGNNRLNHRPIPTHNTFKYEPIGNTTIKIKEEEFLLVDKAVDTSLRKSVMILFKINEKGVLKNYETIPLSIHEANETAIKHVMELNDGKVLVILWNYFNEYYFYYFNANSEFLYKKQVNLPRGIRAIKEISDGDFICTSLMWDSLSFQFYRFDTSGNIKWLVNPYYKLNQLDKTLGSASEVLIANDKIYICGGVTGFGILLIYDMDGNILREFKYDTFYCQQRFCSAFIDSDNSFIIGGYIQHCSSEDKNGKDVSILKIDTNGTILWKKVYDFRNSLGTSDTQGYFNDYGGFMITKANDGGIITNGMSRYLSSRTGNVGHEDALLIKTEPLEITSANKQLEKGNLQFSLLGNLINDKLNINGPVNLIIRWHVYSMQGEVVLNGGVWSEPISIRNIVSGIYTIEIVDRNNSQYFIKFIKI